MCTLILGILVLIILVAYIFYRYDDRNSPHPRSDPYVDEWWRDPDEGWKDYDTGGEA